jgi:AraC-like DNA-binding protein
VTVTRRATQNVATLNEISFGRNWHVTSPGTACTTKQQFATGDTRTVAFLAPARHLLRAKDAIDARYAEPLDVRVLARTARLSQAHFSREFRRAFGETPHQYLLTRRLERAAALLRSSDRSVTEICFLVGRRSLGAFTTSFRRAYGMTPTAYRAAHPPAESIRIPTCVLLAYARPRSSRFREAERTVAALA